MRSVHALPPVAHTTPVRTLEGLPADIVGQICHFVTDDALAFFRTSKSISKTAGVVLRENEDLVEELLKYKGVARQMQEGLFGKKWQESIKRVAIEYVDEGLLQTIQAIFPNLELLEINTRALPVMHQLTPHFANMKKLQKVSCWYQDEEDVETGKSEKKTSHLVELHRVYKNGNYTSREERLKRCASRVSSTFQWTYRWTLTDRMLDVIEPLLKKLPLRELTVSCANITDKDLQFIATIKTLEKLHLSGCHRITSVGVSYLAHLPLVREISIDDTVKAKLSLGNIVLVKPLRQHSIAVICRIARETFLQILSYVFSMDFIKDMITFGLCVLAGSKIVLMQPLHNPVTRLFLHRR
jgi:hypothetical protein